MMNKPAARRAQHGRTPADDKSCRAECYVYINTAYEPDLVSNDVAGNQHQRKTRPFKRNNTPPLPKIGTRQLRAIPVITETPPTPDDTLSPVSVDHIHHHRGSLTDSVVSLSLSSATPSSPPSPYPASPSLTSSLSPSSIPGGNFPFTLDRRLPITRPLTQPLPGDDTPIPRARQPNDDADDVFSSQRSNMSYRELINHRTDACNACRLSPEVLSGCDEPEATDEETCDHRAETANDGDDEDEDFDVENMTWHEWAKKRQLSRKKRKEKREEAAQQIPVEPPTPILKARRESSVQFTAPEALSSHSIDSQVLPVMSGHRVDALSDLTPRSEQAAVQTPVPQSKFWRTISEKRKRGAARRMNMMTANGMGDESNTGSGMNLYDSRLAMQQQRTQDVELAKLNENPYSKKMTVVILRYVMTVLTVAATILIIVILRTTYWFKFDECNEHMNWHEICTLSDLAEVEETCSYYTRKSWQLLILSTLIISTVFSATGSVFSIIAPLTSTSHRRRYYYHSAAEFFTVSGILYATSIISTPVLAAVRGFPDNITKDITNYTFGYCYYLSLLVTLIISTASIAMQLDHLLYRYNNEKIFRAIVNLVFCCCCRCLYSRCRHRWRKKKHEQGLEMSEDVGYRGGGVGRARANPSVEEMDATRARRLKLSRLQSGASVYSVSESFA